MRAKGFTLIELAVVLAIIAILAAVLTPMVTNYIDQSRVARAQADLRTIADAVKLYQRDTGRYPVFDSSSAYSSDTVSKAVIGTNSGGTPIDSGSSWGLPSSLANTSLELYLNNDYSGAGSASFPKASFHGPYISTVDSDPWGNKYLVTAGNLARGSSNHGFVISAGPDGTLQTSRDSASNTLLSAGSSDDLISVIR